MKTKQGLYAARPTSPHLGIYRWQISSTLSILHRLTGIALFGSLSIVTWWMIFWIFSGFNECYIQFLVYYPIIKYALYLISFALFYHTCNGIRHLIWDAGYGFSIKALHMSGWTAVILSLAMTVGFWTLVR